jgi:hypothetical protein
MPRGLDTLTGFVTAPGAVFTAWTMATGDSLAVRAAVPGSNIWLVGAWGFNQVAGVLRVRSPRLHDNVQGIRMRIPASLVNQKLPIARGPGGFQRLFTQDTLIVEQTGSAVGGQIETGSLAIWYDDVPGIAGRFIDQNQLNKFGVNLMGQEVTVTTGVAGGYSGSVAINATNDNFKANTDYALIGGFCDTRVATVRIKGIDTGNLGVGFPGDPTLQEFTADWFVRLSQSSYTGMIPVFNSQNKTGITVDAVSNQISVTTVITLMLMELQQGSVPLAGLGAAQPH